MTEENRWRVATKVLDYLTFEHGCNPVLSEILLRCMRSQSVSDNDYAVLKKAHDLLRLNHWNRWEDDGED